jgi:hypothetical protein
MTVIDTFLWLLLSIVYRRPVGRYGFFGPLPPDPWRAPPLGGVPRRGREPTAPRTSGD